MVVRLPRLGLRRRFLHSLRRTCLLYSSVRSTLTRNRLPSATLTSISSPGVAKEQFIRSLPVRRVLWEVRTTHHAPRRHPSRDPLHAVATPSMGRHTAEGKDGASG
jgi:hypothetical protein